MLVKSKKVVLFIVEGPSDQSALSVILSKIFDQDEEIGRAHV